MADRFRPAWAEIDVGAAGRNAALLARLVGPATLCAVVKADGYGHGAVPLARAARAGGAGWLAVALVEEGVELREAGIDVPILLLSEPPIAAMEAALAYRLVPTVYSEAGVRGLGRAAAAGDADPVDVHLKVNTGMYRVGTEPERAVALAAAIGADPRLRLAALWTHLAVADGGARADLEFTRTQLDRFRTVHDELLAAGLRPPLRHVANSAGAIAFPEARLDMVRCGIALYGLSPTPELATQLSEATGGGRLEPVLSLRAEVSMCRWVDKGERPSYGRRRQLDERSVVATVPLGYADGVPRRLFDTGGEVLIGGVRRPLAGVVTMDQIVVDCGPADPPEVKVGDQVVLIGRQGGDEITAAEWADRLGTINYEVVCGIGPRVPRVLVGGDD
ncbi:MAG TPA: alanine racemase [Acidimicrobiales bacterium]|nr:alanine racemase [Acidimicrobiales bacterium]